MVLEADEPDASEPKPTLLDTVVMPLVRRFLSLRSRPRTPRHLSATTVGQRSENPQKQGKNGRLNGDHEIVSSAHSTVNTVHDDANDVHFGRESVVDPDGSERRISGVTSEADTQPTAAAMDAPPEREQRSAEGDRDSSIVAPAEDSGRATQLQTGRDPKRSRWPWTLPVGIKLILISEVFLFIDVVLRGGLVVGHNATVDDIPWPDGAIASIARFFAANMTPICWMGYLLVFDGLLVLLARRRGEPGIASLRARPNRFIVAWLASVPTWCFFDWINFAYVDAWRYHGLPDDALTRYGGYFIAFAAITPGMLLAAQALLALGWRSWTIRNERTNRWLPWTVVMGTHAILAGVILLLMTADDRPPAALSVNSSMAMLLWPAAAMALITRNLSASCFALGIGWTAWSILVQDPLSCMAMWVGVIFLLDPLCYWMGGPSMIGDWKAGRWGRFLALMAGGALCGLLWEFWNYWALTKWTYHLPFLGAAEHFRYFEMPWLGFLGFLPVSIECCVAVNFAATLLDRLKLRSAEPIGADQAI